LEADEVFVPLAGRFLGARLGSEEPRAPGCMMPKRELK
jgi:hypothetical protein